MTEKEAWEKEQKQKQEQERQRLNRQINFLVMRRMWQVLRGRAKAGSEGQTIYDAFHMSRERYTRIIRGGNVRFSKEELKRLVTETGVRSEIFEGKDCFHFDAITEKDWKGLFELRVLMDHHATPKENETEEARKAREKKERKEKIQEARAFEQYLYSIMKQSDVDLLKNPDLYYFAVYLKSGKPAMSIDIETDLQRMTQRLNSVEFAQLERCRADVLQEYLQGLKRQVDITSTLLRYMELKEKKKSRA